MKVAVLSFAQECAAAHVRALRDMPGVDVVTADPDGPPGDPARGPAMAERLGVACASSWDEVFALRPDAVVVTSEAARRRELVERAAGVGAQVLCALPPAGEVTDAQAMVDACQEAGVRLTLASPACFSPAFSAVRRAIADGDAVGRLMSMHGSYDTGPGPGYGRDPGPGPAPGPSVAQGPVGGGVPATRAAYLLDLVDMVLGGEPAEQVYAQANNVLGGGDPGFESAALVSVRYASGIVAAVDCTWSASGNRSAGGGPVMTFVGDSGSVEFTAAPRLLGGFDVAADTERWEAGGADPIAVMLGEFVTAVGGGPPTGPPTGPHAGSRTGPHAGPLVWPDGAAGVRTMRIVQAAYESVRTGQPVELAVAPAGRRA
ncbi:Gfo/Idh/MocA family oxidoreductase [Streptomyces sp. NPDC005925]|uniref:Gfo/Idh/MocA family protein n=1 Tax=Streptomyces sp. NPDC005925 TaxID=3157172 RepID=UPI0033EA98CD